MHKKILLVACSGLAFIAFLAASKKRPNPAITASEFQEHVRYLASDELEGRFTGSTGSKQAAEYIKSEFESYGLEPAFGKTYYQEYPFISDLELTLANTLQISSGTATKPTSSATPDTRFPSLLTSPQPTTPISDR